MLHETFLLSQTEESDTSLKESLRVNDKHFEDVSDSVFHSTPLRSRRIFDETPPDEQESQISLRYLAASAAVSVNLGSLNLSPERDISQESLLSTADLSDDVFGEDGISLAELFAPMNCKRWTKRFIS